jgi:hypothetical protein
MPNPRRICGHPSVELRLEHSGARVFVLTPGGDVYRGIDDLVPTGRVRFICRHCGYDRSFTSVDQAPRWVQDLVKLAEAPA